MKNFLFIKQNKGFTRIVDFRLTKMLGIFAGRKSKFSPSRKFTTGFTLVETLVAISILMMAVTGPLYFAASSLKAAVYARDQITAFYLAQDAFEQIREIRDNNLINNVETGWLTSIVDNTNGICNSAFGCRIAPALPPTSCLTGTCQPLTISSASGFYGYGFDITTPFTRTILVQKTSDPDEAKVSVTISWRSGTIDRNFTAYEFLRNLNPTPTT